MKDEGIQAVMPGVSVCVQAEKIDIELEKQRLELETRNSIRLALESRSGFAGLTGLLDKTWPKDMYTSTKMMSPTAADPKVEGDMALLIDPDRVTCGFHIGFQTNLPFKHYGKIVRTSYKEPVGGHAVSTSAFRPICLLNIMGKLYEHLIKNRLEEGFHIGFQTNLPFKHYGKIVRTSYKEPVGGRDA
ncbi:hypothetical protein QE152_g30116 [Popillia japonica]|uniref:Uncharacterized protein n=1 Tax=Popillia japonica TaxID=7064 RepID=A0AAW1JG54_POPJA